MLRERSFKVEFKTAVKFSDVIIAVVFIISSIVAYVSLPPVNLPNLSTIILGLVVMSGLLIAFAGFWLARIYRDSEEPIRKWMKKRLVAVVLIMFLVAAFVIIGVNDLVKGNMENAYRYSIIGTFAILFTLFDILVFIVLHGYSEKVQ